MTTQSPSVRKLRHGIWEFGGSYLLLHGSLLSGEACCISPGETSPSDIDLLWLGPSLPPLLDLEGIAANLAGTLAIRGFSHIGLKRVRPDLSRYPPWLTNAWVPALRLHLRSLPNLAAFLPPDILSLKPLRGADLAEAIDFAWRYAALALSKTAYPHPRALYTLAKLHLVLARIQLQVHGVLPLSYFQSVHLAATGSRDLARGLEWSLAVKLGRRAPLDLLAWEKAWTRTCCWSLATLARLASSGTQQILDLIQWLTRWAKGLEKGIDRNQERCAVGVAQSLWARIRELPEWESRKAAEYEEAAELWQRKQRR